MKILIIKSLYYGRTYNRNFILSKLLRSVFITLRQDHYKLNFLTKYRSDHFMLIIISLMMLISATFLNNLNFISDPHIERYKKHNLLDIILLALTAVMSVSERRKDIENFGHIKLDWLRRYRDFEVGILLHGTIARVINHLKTSEIEQAFQTWISSLIEKTGCYVVAIDRKTDRRSFTTKAVINLTLCHRRR